MKGGNPVGYLITPVFSNKRQLLISLCPDVVSDRAPELWLQQLQKTELISLVLGTLIYYLALKNEEPRNRYRKYIWEEIAVMK